MHHTGLEQAREPGAKGKMAAAAADEDLEFQCMTEAEMRQWVEANPGRVDDRDNQGDTPL